MASSDYFSMDDFTVMRGVEPSSTTSPNEDQVQKYIDLAVLQFEGEVGVYREQTSVSETLFADSKGLTVSNVPLTSITSITQSNGDMINPVHSALTSTDYRLYDEERGKVLLRSPYPTVREYTITYDSGYSSLNMPSTIKEIIYLMVMYRVFQFHLFDNNLGSNVTKIVDVDVYREITKGGDPFAGFASMDRVISDAKANVKGALRTYLKW